MKAKVWIKWLVGVFVLTLMLSFCVACKGQKGEIKQPPHQFTINFYASAERDSEESVGFKVLHHNGCEPRMYVYTAQDSFDKPIYVKLDCLKDVFGQEIDEKFYQVKYEPKWKYVETSQTLIWDYEMYRYNEDDELYPAYAIRIQWEILIDEVDDPPHPMHGEWVSQTRVPPTCTEKGYVRYLCACGCGSEKLEYEDPKGHSWTPWTSKNDGRNHERFCVNDLNHHEVELCHGGVATCQQQATCEVCNWAYGAFGDHAYQNGVCIYCESGEYSVSVNFRLSDDESYYTATKRYLTDADKEHFGAQLERVEIPALYKGKPVKEIADNAFAYETVVKEVVIAEGVEKIGSYAFRGCTNLSRINLPSSVKVVENSAFYGVLRYTSYNKNGENL